MPFLRECLDSVIHQGNVTHEIIVVNDGSTDDTAPVLDEYAASYPDLVTVVHQENSGGAASPRNRGIELAKGEFIFFVDADDFIAENALSAMVNHARRNGSDVLLAKMAGVDGRKVPLAMFHSSQDHVDLISSNVYWTLTSLKLFRRRLIDNLNLRFDESLATGEDQPFVAMAMIHAQDISILADRPYYFARYRRDGSSITSIMVDPQPRIDLAMTMINLVYREVSDPKLRQKLLDRHIQVEVMRAVRRVARSEAKDYSKLEPLRALLTEIDHPVLNSKMRATVRLHYYLFMNLKFDQLLAMVDYAETRRIELKLRNREWFSLLPERIDVKNHRCFANYPGWGNADLPDDLFDITDEIPKTVGLTDVLATSHEFSILTTKVEETAKVAMSAHLMSRPFLGLRCEGGSAGDQVYAVHDKWSTLAQCAPDGTTVLPLLGTGEWRTNITGGVKLRNYSVIFIRDWSLWRASVRDVPGGLQVSAKTLVSIRTIKNKVLSLRGLRIIRNKARSLRARF